MSFTVTATFATAAEAIAFLSGTAPGASLFATAAYAPSGAVPTPPIPTPEKPKAPKPAKTEAPAVSPPTAAPTPEPTPEPAPATPKLEYAPIGQQIAELVAAGKAPAIKEIFKGFAHRNGSGDPVKTGRDIADDDLLRLRDQLTDLAAEVLMS